MSKNKSSYSEARQIARELAALLGEKHHGVIGQIRRIIQLFGADFAREMYTATQEIEAKGGVMLPDNSRRRTPGGVYLQMVRSKLADEQKRQIFYGTARAGIPLLSWTERIALVESLQAHSGTVKSLKVSLRGRPERIEKQAEVTVFTLNDETLIDNLPRPLPKPPSTPAVVTVYVEREQWEQVEGVVANPPNVLLVEGVCAFDPQTQKVVVFATSVQISPQKTKSSNQ